MEMPCSATSLERLTDAGTRPLISLDEEVRDRDSEVLAEERHLWCVLAGLVKDRNPDGTARPEGWAAFDVAAGLIDREVFVREIIEMIAANHTGAFLFPKGKLWDLAEKYVREEVKALADARVPV